MKKPYPKIGSIQVAKAGDCIVHVWGHEGESENCFTGVELLTSDVSVFWMRDAFVSDSLFKRPLLHQFMQARRTMRRALDR